MSSHKVYTRWYSTITSDRIDCPSEYANKTKKGRFCKREPCHKSGEKLEIRHWAARGTVASRLALARAGYFRIPGAVQKLLC